MFTKRTVGEHLLFGSRTVCQNTPAGTRQTIEMKDNPYVVHCYVRLDGLAASVISDKEYSERVAFSLINEIMREYEATNKGAWKAEQKDKNEEPKFLQEYIKKYQDPTEADKLLKIQKNLDEVKGIMHKNIDELLKRGVKLDDLMQKSEDLSATSVVFYQKSKDTNRCCKMY